MKKAILFAAALFVAVASFAQNEYNYQKRSLFEQLPIRGNDIVFLGNSITDGCEWAELFNNRPKKHKTKRGGRHEFSNFKEKIHT